MFLVGIDIGKNSHMFCVMDYSTGDILVDPSSIKNNQEEFEYLLNRIKYYQKKNILIKTEGTGHYHSNLLK